MVKLKIDRNGLAGVRLGGRWGFINTRGDWVVMPQYEDVRRFREDFAPVRDGQKWGVIDAAGRIRTEKPASSRQKANGLSSRRSTNGIASSAISR
jgi:hypothetical protein